MHTNSQMEAGGVGYGMHPRRGTIRRLPVLVWSTKALAARWYDPTTANLPSQLTATGDGLLTGSVTNQTGVDLSDARLLYGSWGWRLGDLPEGRTVRIDRDLDPLRTRTVLLKGRRAGGQLFVPEEATTDELLTLSMFYKALGGHRFAGLQDHGTGQLDMSHQLRLGRAVLVARRADRGSQLLVGDEQLSPTGNELSVYRFLLPVDPPAE